MRAAIEGILSTVHEKKHKKVRTGLDIHDCHFITMSDIHQKLGTLS